MGDIDNLLDPVPDRPTDPEPAYDGGWEQGLEAGEGFEDHLLGEEPVVPELQLTAAGGGRGPAVCFDSSGSKTPARELVAAGDPLTELGES